MMRLLLREDDVFNKRTYRMLAFHRTDLDMVAQGADHILKSFKIKSNTNCVDSTECSLFRFVRMLLTVSSREVWGHCCVFWWTHFSHNFEFSARS